MGKGSNTALPIYFMVKEHGQITTSQYVLFAYSDVDGKPIDHCHHGFQALRPTGSFRLSWEH